MAEIPGWYMDGVEQHLGGVIAAQRERQLTVPQLVDGFLDRTVHDGSGEELSPKDHVEALALCLAICVARLARIDMPS